MTPDDIKALRKELRCTPQELGDALGLDAKTIMAWEQADMFPTKRYIDAMNGLREQGPDAIPRKRRRARSETPMQLLADPEIWRILRKLITHADFRAQVHKLAADYPDPE